jgi:hypothetical protein
MPSPTMVRVGVHFIVTAHLSRTADHLLVRRREVKPLLLLCGRFSSGGLLSADETGDDVISAPVIRKPRTSFTIVDLATLVIELCGSQSPDRVQARWPERRTPCSAQLRHHPGRGGGQVLPLAAKDRSWRVGLGATRFAVLRTGLLAERGTSVASFIPGQTRAARMTVSGDGGSRATFGSHLVQGVG